MDGSAQHTTKEVEAVGPGATLGEYALGARIERRLNADVYEATSTSSGAPRIVYVLRPDAVSDHPFVHQVICEVDAARWLRHPAVAKVDGYGDTPGGGMYVAADRPPGRTLFSVLAEGGKMTPRRVVRMAHRLVEVLEEAHNVGLVHGRLSPAAILVSEELDAAGNPLMTLTGFGTGAVALDGDVSAAEQPYVSPERMAGRELDVRADVYGLASILHHALVGDVPAIPAAKAAVADGSSLADVIAAARAADVKRRPATVKAFWEDLLAALVDEAADAHRDEVELLPALLPPPVVSRPSAPMFGPPLPQGGPATWPVLDARLDMLAPPQASIAPAALPVAPAAIPATAIPAPAPMPATTTARHSGGADVWGSSSLPTLAPMAAAPPAPAPPAPLALDPMPAAPPTPEATPASVRVAAEPPPHVQFREAWERHGPPQPPSTTQPPRRRRRTALALLWWLAVPAAGAAAATWPLSSGGDERAASVSNSTAAFSMVPGQPLQAAPPAADTGADVDAVDAPPADDLRTADSRGDVVVAAPQVEPAVAAEREAAPAPRRLPRVAPVNLPDVRLPGVELPKRTTVRTSDFPVAPPGGR